MDISSGFGPARFASPRRPRTTIAVYKFGVPPLTTGAGQCGAGSRTASLDAGYVSGANVTAIVELAFGQIKQGRGFRQFLFRVMRKLPRGLGPHHTPSPCPYLFAIPWP
jgi:hypothetical protein